LPIEPEQHEGKRMIAAAATSRRRRSSRAPYILDEQVGFILRQVSQRHSAIFADRIGDDLTPTQWAVLAKLLEKGSCSQNLLGRLTAMDAATIKGVVDRLAKRGFTATRPDPKDGRRLMVALTEEGHQTAQRAQAHAIDITEETLAPLTPEERASLLELLKKLR
jgi:DNA-binding MarR family transcriptional regulator